MSGKGDAHAGVPPSPRPPEENPILAETGRLLSASQFAEAVTFAYLNVVQDVIRAFSLRPPKQWTHREFLTWGIRSDMGYFTNLLPRLYALYEPVRYGEQRDWKQDDLLGLLRLVYAEEPLVRLYSQPYVWPPPSNPPGPSGPSETA